MTTTPGVSAPHYDIHLYGYNWLLVPQSQDGDPLNLETIQNYSDRSIQIDGTFGGATAILLGSNDGVTYLTLKDAFGNDISITTSNALKQITEVCNFIKPRVTGGDGTTSLNFRLFGRKPYV